MKTISVLLFFCIAFHFSVEGVYKHSKYVDEQSWKSLEPYFLPENHPIKSKLDAIFKKKRVTTNFETMLEAHFTWRKQRKAHCVIIANHEKLKGYLIKCYLDDQLGIDEVPKFLKRIRGAHVVRDAIDRLGYQKYFTVPQKWVYPLPDGPKSLLGLQRKNFILVVEDMNVMDPNKILKTWRGNKITTDLLHAFFTLLNDVGLNDSIYIRNVPFTKDYKLAFIDTEYYHAWPIQYAALTPFLSSRMSAYWNQLTGYWVVRRK